MKKLFSVIILFTAFAVTASAQHYTPVEQSSVVTFTVLHQMIFKSTVTGTFKGFKGMIVFDPNNLAQASFNVSVQLATLNSGIGMRDKDLQKDKYFDQPHFPLIIIKSESITKATGNDSYIFTGTLTMKGTTKKIMFPFTAKQLTGGYEFKGGFQLNRLDYNVGPDNSIDKNVQVDLSVTAK